MIRKLGLVIALCCLGACSDDPASAIPGSGDGDGDSGDADSGDGDSGDGDNGDGDNGDGDGDTGDGDATQGDGDGNADPGEDCETTLKATIRDFTPDHLDFENPGFGSDVEYPGLVQNELGPDKKPVYAHPGPTIRTVGPDEFKQWYNDVEGVNQSFEVDIELVDDGTGKFVYDNQFFFPLDGMGYGNFGKDTMGRDHNFLFTTEVHTEFEYKGGEVFQFIGDDDLWLFINGKLAIDLGGLHPPRPGIVRLDDDAEKLGIEVGNTYSMDIFHAERHTDASTFRVETTIGCLKPVVVL